MASKNMWVALPDASSSKEEGRGERLQGNAGDWPHLALTHIVQSGDLRQSLRTKKNGLGT